VSDIEVQAGVLLMECQTNRQIPIHTNSSCENFPKIDFRFLLLYNDYNHHLFPGPSKQFYSIAGTELDLPQAETPDSEAMCVKGEMIFTPFCSACKRLC
jgi:hypothetical protein